MDHRGRELPEVGQHLDTTWRAPEALQPRSSTRSASSFDFGIAYDPARAMGRPVSTRAPGSERRSWGGRAGLAAALLVIAGLSAVLLNNGAADRAFDRDRIATFFGFGIEQVSLTGHRFTSDSDLFAALDLKSARSLASFDPDAIRRRFEQLPWVSSVEITRVWPGQLAIRVSERRPTAVWERGETAVLIDGTGRVLGPVGRDAPLALPRVAGAGANAVAAPLWTVLDRHPDIKAVVERATRVGERRWTLELTGGGRIHLPSDGEVSALARIAAEPRLKALIGSPGNIVDLRAPGRIAVRPAETASLPRSAGSLAGGGM